MKSERRYNQILELNERGSILIDSKTKFIEMQLVLFEMGYQWAIYNKSLYLPENFTSLWLHWNILKDTRNHMLISYSSNDLFSNNSTTINFDDYFDIKEEFRGHKLEKYEL